MICAKRDCENEFKPNKYRNKRFCSRSCSLIEYRWKVRDSKKRKAIHPKICANRNCENTFINNRKGFHQKYCLKKCRDQEERKAKREQEFEKLKLKYDRRDKQFKELQPNQSNR